MEPPGAHALRFEADRPDKPEELARDGHDHLLFAFAARDQPRVALMQTMLRLPRKLPHLDAAAPLTDRERLTDGRAVPVGPRGFPNQVESWFSKIERNVIARSVFTSVPDLKRKLMRYIRHYNKSPKTVKWKYYDPTRRITPTSAVTVH